MSAAFRLSGVGVELIAPEAGLSGWRAITAEDSQRFAIWMNSYRLLANRETVQAGLLTLGQQLYAWLNGSDRWLDRLLVAFHPPLIIEFRAANLDDTAYGFLQVPWELLASEEGFLAADALLNYCPLRRIGEPESVSVPSDLCLGLVFMAAVPRGASELDFESEESAILNATSTLDLDLEVEESGNPDLLAARLTQAEAIQVLHLSCHGQSQPEPVLLLEDHEGGELLTTGTVLIDLLPDPPPRLLFLSAYQTAQRGQNPILIPPPIGLSRQNQFPCFGWKSAAIAEIGLQTLSPLR